MKLTCPLGHRCEVRDDSNNVIERCHWYTQLRGQDPQSGESIDKWGCAMAFLPILQIETSREVSGVHAATNDFRNKMIGQAPSIIIKRLENGD